MRKENWEYLNSLKNCPICNEVYFINNKKCCCLCIVCDDNNEFYISYKINDHNDIIYTAIIFDYDTNDLNFYYEAKYIHTEKFNNAKEIIEFIKTIDIKNYIDKLLTFQ